MELWIGSDKKSFCEDLGQTMLLQLSVGTVVMWNHHPFSASENSSVYGALQEKLIEPIIIFIG